MTAVMIPSPLVPWEEEIKHIPWVEEIHPKRGFVPSVAEEIEAERYKSVRWTDWLTEK